MPITRKFRETVSARAQSDTRFRAAMLTEAINGLLAGDLDTGKAMLRDYVNATITFDGLAKSTRIPPKSLQRMLGPSGNPTSSTTITPGKSHGLIYLPAYAPVGRNLAW